MKTRKALSVQSDVAAVSRVLSVLRLKRFWFTLPPRLSLRSTSVLKHEDFFYNTTIFFLVLFSPAKMADTAVDTTTATEITAKDLKEKKEVVEEAKKEEEEEEKKENGNGEAPANGTATNGASHEETDKEDKAAEEPAAEGEEEKAAEEEADGEAVKRPAEEEEESVETKKQKTEENGKSTEAEAEAKA